MNKIKKGLGRGLSSLIGETKIEQTTNKLSISDLYPNKLQPRKIFDQDSLNDLEKSINFELGNCNIQFLFNNKLFFFIVKKFSPFIQMISTEPLSFFFAIFSNKTFLTASDVSLIFICCNLIPYFS